MAGRKGIGRYPRLIVYALVSYFFHFWFILFFPIQSETFWKKLKVLCYNIHITMELIGKYKRKCRQLFQ